MNKDIHVCDVVLMVQKDMKVTLMCLFDYYVNAEVWSYQFEGNVYVFARCVNKLFQFDVVDTFFACSHSRKWKHLWNNTCRLILVVYERV